MSQLKDLVVTGKARFIGQVYANNLVGKISEADIAYKDTLNQNISATYIKDASVSGKTVTFIKGNGSTFSFDTYDTTYTQASSDTLGLVKVGQNLSIDNNGILSAYNLQYDTMPTADESMAGKVIQYTGETTANYTKGYFYKCVQNPDASVPGEYTGPDGNIYEYIWSANVYDADYVVYSHYPFCYWTQRVQSTDKPYLLTGVSENNNLYLGSLGTRQGSYYALFTSFYPQGFSNDTDVIITRNGEAMHADWSWAVSTSVYESTNTKGFDTVEECFAYLTASAYIWEQVDSQPEYTLPNASTATLGGIKVGQNLSIDENGVLSASDSYVLPAATASTLGGIKVGENLTIDNTGVLSAEAATKIVPATNISVSPIADGSNSDVLTFEFNCKKAVDMIEFFANVNLLVSTTVSNENYSDCVLTITYSLDDVVKATLNQTYRDGYNIVSLNYIITELTQGNHVFKVNFAPVGGSIS